MPTLALKHSRIIHRRGMRARLLGVSFATEPPPTSIERSVLCFGGCEDHTAVCSSKPNLLDIRLLVMTLPGKIDIPFIRMMPSIWPETPVHGKLVGENRRECRGTYTRRSSRDNACRKYLIQLLAREKGNILGRNPTELTVSLFINEHESSTIISQYYEEYTYQTPTNSTFTLIEKVCLNSSQSLLRLYM